LSYWSFYKTNPILLCGPLPKVRYSLGDGGRLFEAKNAKQTQISSFSSENRGLLEKQSQNMGDSQCTPERFVWRFTKRSQTRFAPMKKRNEPNPIFS
jgi:hypothetical protein